MTTDIKELMAPCFLDVYKDMRRGLHGEYWLGGGRGSGKSSFAALCVVTRLLRDREASCIVYRRVAATLRDSVYACIARMIERMGLTPLFRFGRSPLEIELRATGQRILFRGADDPLKSKSIALKKGYFALLWFEELSEFSCAADVRSIIQSVMRGKNGQVILSYNPPPSARHWVNIEARAERPDRLVHKSSYSDMPPGWLGDRFISEAQALKNTNPRAYANEYLGEVTGTGGSVFENLELRRITDAELMSFDRFFSGLDFGFAVDPDALTVWAYDARQRRLYAADEFVMSRTGIDALAREVKKRAIGCVYCDSADPRMIAELRARGINAAAVKKGPGSREHGFRWLQSLSAIVIDERRTPAIAREFCGFEYARDKNGDFIADYPDGDDHTIDSARYALSMLINVRRAITC